MTVLPIVERELRVAARRRATYWLRVTAALAAIAVFGWMLLTLLRDHVPPASHGRYLFRALFGLAFGYCLFIGARLTADCLSEEKRNGTLGLLFLTDLKGYDVVLGKLAATSLHSIYALLAILPVIWLPVQMGGVSASDLWQSALVLLNTIFFSLAAGIFVSSLSRNERIAMCTTVFVALLATFGPFILAFVIELSLSHQFDDPRDSWPILALSPGYGLGYVLTRSTFFAGFAALPGESFWWSLLLVHLLSWALLLLASQILPRVWQARDSNSRLEQHGACLEQWTYGRAEARRAHRTRLLNVNPFLWLVSRERWKPSLVWLYLGAVAGMWLWGWSNYDALMFDQKTLVPTVLLFQTFLKLWVVTETCDRLAEDRRSGALELLLSTPLTARDILRGQWLALKRQFAKPLAVVLVLEFFLLRHQFTLAKTLINLALLLADVVTLGWVGMWLGLTARNLNRAILGTIGRVLVLPWVASWAVTLVFDGLLRLSGLGPFEPTEQAQVCFWFGMGLANNFLFGVCWARWHLLNDFREAATPGARREKMDWFSRRFRRPDEKPA
jgi:ABC-type transport system involved in multi-copper enzyme maturation permease subunit